jgi:peptidyl-dipeptidase A
MSLSYFAAGAAVTALAMCAAGRSAAETGNAADARARQFIKEHEAVIRPMEIEVGLAWWAANVSGKDEDFQKKQDVETRLDVKLSDPKRFAELKAIRDARPKDPILAREIEVLYLQYLAKQVDPELLTQMLARSNAVDKAFNVYRARVDGKELTANEVLQVLQDSTDSARRKAVWESSKGVGPIVEADLKALVKLRNEAARKLGFKDYHVMQLYLNEQNQDQVLKLFDELDALTRGPFHAAKAEIDAALAKKYGLPVEQLRPWHYNDPFFQESPAVFGANPDTVFRKVDIPKVCRAFYDGIGLPIDDVLARSDLYEKKGKNPHAFCTDIDRAGDVRVLANIVPSEQWMSTMLHELGHAVYSSKNIPASVPYVLRGEAHILNTEGVAMMFERFASNAEWLAAVGVKVPDPKAFDANGAKLRRNQLLIFSRWCQVMFRFEKELYANPNQDLNKLWWDLVEKYQELKRPEGRSAPDFAAKIHICSAPAYYHNYMLGQLFASQLHAAVAREVLGGADPATAIYVGNHKAGEFFIKKVFAPGRTLSWNALTRFATGEDLNAKAFAAEFK